MIVLPAQAPPARRWLAHLVRAAAGVIRAGDRFDDVFPFEADAVAALARREGVAPLVHCGLVAGRIADPVPGSFRRVAREAWEAARHRSRVVLETGAAVRTELADAAVDAVAVGASALVRGKDDLYLEPGLRPVERLDLVLPASDLPRAVTRLRGLGLAPAGPHAPGASGSLRPVRLVRRVAGRPVVLALHTQVGGGRVRRLGGDRFLAVHAVRGADGHADASVSGQLLFGAAQLARTRRLPWIGLLDLHRLVEARPDWTELLREAGATGLRRDLYVGLAASRELLRSPIPKEVLAELAPGPLRRRLLHWRLAVGAREPAGSAPASSRPSRPAGPARRAPAARLPGGAR